LIHFELGNFDLLEYLINSTYRYLKQKKNIFAGEQAILDFMKHALKAADKKELAGAFEDLCISLRKAQTNPGASSLFSLFDFISWAESKRTGMSYVEYSRKHNK
jgi:hypothetical protein